MIAVNSDFSDLDGTCCYCSAESAGRIRTSIAALPLRALHLLGTGDYHYVSLFYLERVSEPFLLLLFDNHPDDQPCAFGGDLLSCGSWVADAVKLPELRTVSHIRNSGDLKSLAEGGLPVYLSIDLDVLSEDYVRTNWDQGTMRLDELLALLGRVASCRRIIGADLCGGITIPQGASDHDLTLNGRAYDAVSGFFAAL